MIKRIRQWLSWRKSTSDECTRLHGKATGKLVRLPASLRDFDSGYKALIRELGKR